MTRYSRQVVLILTLTFTYEIFVVRYSLRPGAQIFGDFDSECVFSAYPACVCYLQHLIRTQATKRRKCDALCVLICSRLTPALDVDKHMYVVLCSLPAFSRDGL